MLPWVGKSNVHGVNIDIKELLRVSLGFYNVGGIRDINLINQ